MKRLQSSLDRCAAKPPHPLTCLTTTHNINRHFGALAERLAGRRRAPEGKGRILALEYFINSQRMKGFIREGKTHQVRAQMQTGSDDFAG